jgi:hypothetical protein
MLGYSYTEAADLNRWRVVTGAPEHETLADYLDEPTARLIAASREMQGALDLFVNNSAGRYDAREWLEAKKSGRAALAKSRVKP